MDDNFELGLISDFPGYDSCRDKTNLSPEWMVKNSKNMYKKLSGTIANRFGRKYTGPLDGRSVGVNANYDWYTSNGTIRPIRVTADFVMSVFYANQWIQLVTGLQSTRTVFDKWYDGNQQQDALLMVNGGSGINYWSGGITKIASTSTVTQAAISISNTNAGAGYVVGNILQLGGGSALNPALIRVTGVSSGAISSFSVINPGDLYSTGVYATTNLPVHGIVNTGNSATFTVNTVGTSTTTWYVTKDTTDGFPSWEQAGFLSYANGETEPTFTVAGNSYSYLGDFGSAKLVVTTNPLSLTAGQIAFNPVTAVIDAVTGSTSLPFGPGSPWTNDFIKVIANQVYIGCYRSRVIWVSSGENYIEDSGSSNMAFLFTFIAGILTSGVTNNPLGAAFNIILDDNPTGISFKSGVPTIFGLNGGLYEINITTQTIDQGFSFGLTSGTGNGSANPALVEQVTTAVRNQLYSRSTPQAHEFIVSNGNYIIWLGLDNQLHVYGATKDIFLSDVAPSISQQIQDELTNVNFTGGAIAWINEYIFVTAPLSSKHYVFQQRQQVEENGEVKTERIWNPPQIEGISRFSNINGVIYGHALDQPMMYQIYDTNQWHDDGVDTNNNLIALPYECRLSMAYRQLPGKGKYIARSSNLRFDKIYWEGYIQPGTPLYGSVYYDYQGCTVIDGYGGVVGVYINGVRNQAEISNPLLNPTKLPAKLYSYTNAPSLGSDFLGDNPLGQGITPFASAQDYLPKFRTINKMEIVYCREYQIEAYSYDLDARWEILALGTNLEIAPEGEYELTR